MKRIADNQLTRDGDGEDSTEEGGQIGMNRASDEVIATRKVRGLPKRLGGPSSSTQPSTSTSTTADALPKPAFGGFGGFGATSSTTPSEPSVKPTFGGFGGFSTSTAPAADSAPKFGFSAIGSTTTTTSVKPAETKPPSFTFGSTPSTFPSTSTTTSTSKTSQLFGASISAASAPSAAESSKPAVAANPFANFGTASGSTKPAEAQPTKSQEQSTKNTSLEYYLSLRGLNHSILTALENAIAEDPFVNLPFESIAQQYAKHRKEIQEKFDKASKASTSQAPASSTPATSNPAPAPTTFSLPAPPAGGFSFGGVKTTTTSTTTPSSSNSLGFIPKPAGEAEKKSTFTFGSSTTSAPVNSLPFSFSAPSLAPAGDKPREDKPGFAPLFGNNAFAPKPAQPASGETSAPKPLAFSGFGGFSNTAAAKKDEANGDDKKAADDKAASTSSANPFAGLGTKPPTTSYFSFGNKPASTPPAAPTTPSSDAKRPSIASFGFGSSPGSSFAFKGVTPSGGLTSTASGSLGNPVGFSFGSPPKESPFASASGSSTQAAAAEPQASSSAPAVTPAADSKDGDIVGEGEEDEDTDVSERGKVYKLNTAEKSWTDMGIGYFKLKTHKETGKKRVLCRMENTGRVLVNFNLYKGLNVKAGGKPTIIVFSGYDKQEQIGYQVRFKTEASATNVRTKINDAVAAL
ncbi:hypothetical protein FRC02_009329 [Tulasnella sp. 418]|nr:hypothetical protein FRC02_009329 [Tulasnella sp. 418]